MYLCVHVYKSREGLTDAKRLMFPFNRVPLNL